MAVSMKEKGGETIPTTYEDDEIAFGAIELCHAAGGWLLLNLAHVPGGWVMALYSFWWGMIGKLLPKEIQVHNRP